MLERVGPSSLSVNVKGLGGLGGVGATVIEWEPPGSEKHAGACAKPDECPWRRGRPTASPGEIFLGKLLVECILAGRHPILPAACLTPVSTRNPGSLLRVALSQFKSLFPPNLSPSHLPELFFIIAGTKIKL